jgi:cobalamin biosynthesis protein CobD/CbiB
MRSRPRVVAASAVALLAAALVVAPSGQAARGLSAMSSMGASNQPEHVADALAAIKKGKTRTARNALQQAIADRYEPKAARTDAADALQALNDKHSKSARRHAEFGAGVEHFTYALRSLDKGKTATSRGHLAEAVQISRFQKYAQAALDALRAGRKKAARQHIVDGLHKAKNG